jgi:hypothetical protein
MRATGARLAGQALGDSRLHQLTHREENVFFATGERNHLTSRGFDNPANPFLCLIGYRVKNTIIKLNHLKLSKNLIVVVRLSSIYIVHILYQTGKNNKIKPKLFKSLPINKLRRAAIFPVFLCCRVLPHCHFQSWRFATPI